MRNACFHLYFPFSTQVYDLCGERKNGIFPLYNGIDLLIVDESGQVSPELAVPSFSLAKQAILVGDIQQIEPVWSISDEYSFINLKNLGIVSNQSSEKIPFLGEQRFPFFFRKYNETGT